MYSERVMDHFHRPRNLGQLDQPDVTARGENPVCGDEAEFTLRLEGDVIAEARFRATGCVAALAACSALTELVVGMRVEEAAALTAERLLEVLDGLPRNKRHGAALAVDVLRSGLRNPLA